MSISIAELAKLYAYDLIPHEVVSYWQDKNHDPFFAARQVVEKRKERKLFRWVFGTAVLVGLMVLIGSHVASRYEPTRIMSPLEAIVLLIGAVSFAGFWSLGCNPHEQEDEYQRTAESFLAPYNVFWKQMKLSFYDFRTLEHGERLKLVADRLVELAGHVLKSEEQERKISRDGMVDLDLPRITATTVKQERDRLHAFHTAVQRLGLAPKENVRIYFEQAAA